MRVVYPQRGPAPAVAAVSVQRSTTPPTLQESTGTTTDEVCPGFLRDREDFPPKPTRPRHKRIVDERVFIAADDG
jgi:hypothetical protein